MLKQPDLGSMSREFIPVLLLIITPFIEFMKGYGVIKGAGGLDWFFILPAVFGLIMMAVKRRKIRNIFIFMLLAVLNFALSMPYMHSEFLIKDGDPTYLIISYEFIVFQYFLFAMSFFRNDPYYVDYFTTESMEYRVIYYIAGVFFTIIALYHLFLFYRIYTILQYMYVV